MANKTLAAILNFIVWGIGYLYIGKRKPLGWLMLAGYLLVHYYVYAVGFMSFWTDVPGIFSFAGHIFISLGLAYDVYKE